jgi:hypothetical protein
MKEFLKSDLKYIYSWTLTKKIQNAWIKGFPSDRFLYRGEGYEVLPFINRYLRSRTIRNLAAFQLIEKLIQCGISKSIASHAKIKEWLDNNLIR